MHSVGNRFRNALVVVKQTPYESYLQLKAQGKAPAALKWEVLRSRYDTHRSCVDHVDNILRRAGIAYSIIGRDELHRGVLADKDLLVGVGGDGTILNCASFLDHRIPLIGINSDPNRASTATSGNAGSQGTSEGMDSAKQNKGKAHRRSTGCSLREITAMCQFL